MRKNVWPKLATFKILFCLICAAYSEKKIKKVETNDVKKAPHLEFLVKRVL